MKTKNIPLDYANNLVYELEKAFWDERGKGARFRMTTVGSEYFKEKCLPLLRSKKLEIVLETIGNLLKEERITGEVSFSQEERLLRLCVKGCIHRPVEEKMASRGIEPFTCMPANLVVLALEKKFNRPVELAEIRLEDGACQLMLVVFESRPTLG